MGALRNHIHYRDIARDRLGAGTRSTPAACRRDRLPPGPPRASLVQGFDGLATRTGRDWK